MSFDLVELGTVATFINGDRGKNYPSKGSFVKEGIAFINAGCLSDNNELDSSKLNYITEDNYNRLSSGKIQRNDILFCLRGSLGKFAVIRNDNLGALASSLVIIRAKSNVYVEYLKHYFSSPLAKKEIDSYENGAAQPNLSATDLKKFTIPLPSLSEQKRIADILDKADDLRQKRQQSIAKLDELLQATFIDMFGDPVTNPKNLKVLPLTELCTKITDGTHQSPKWEKEGVPFLFISNIVENEINYQSEKYIGLETYHQLTKSTKIEIDDILYTTVGSYGNVAKVQSDKLFCFQRHIAHIKPNKDKVNPTFLEYMLSSYGVKMQADRLVRGVAQKTLNLTELKSLLVFDVDKNEQDFFVRKAQAMLKLKKQNKLALKQQNQLFQSLQQQAFNGTL